MVGKIVSKNQENLAKEILRKSRIMVKSGQKWFKLCLLKSLDWYNLVV
jgi:hypothetical protein